MLARLPWAATALQRCASEEPTLKRQKNATRHARDSGFAPSTGAAITVRSAEADRELQKRMGHTGKNQVDRSTATNSARHEACQT